MKLLKTGIAGLDEFLTGGLPPRVLLLTGLPGAGNEVFARQIAYTRAKQVGITYFIVNETADSVRNDMAVYNWDLAPLEENGNWRFKVITKKMDLQEAIFEEMSQRRTVIIDSISELLLTREVDEVIDLLTAMSNKNKNGDEYHLLLLTEGMQDPRDEIAMQHFAEGVIVFTATWATHTVHTDILIKKMMGTFVPARRLPIPLAKKGFLLKQQLE